MAKQPMTIQEKLRLAALDELETDDAAYMKKLSKKVAAKQAEAKKDILAASRTLPATKKGAAAGASPSQVKATKKNLDAAKKALDKAIALSKAKQTATEENDEDEDVPEGWGLEDDSP